MGILDIDAASQVNYGKMRLLVFALFSTSAFSYQLYFTIFLLPTIRRKEDTVDLILSSFTMAATILTVVGTELNVIFKSKAIQQLYIEAIVLRDSITPLKLNPLIDKSFVYQVFAKVVFDIVVMVIFCGVLSFEIGDFHLFLNLFKVVFFLSQFLVTMLIVVSSMAIFNYSAYLMEIVLMKMQRSAATLDSVNRSFENKPSTFIMKSDELSDEIGRISENFSEIIRFSRRAIQILQFSLFTVCFQTWFLIVGESTRITGTMLLRTGELEVIEKGSLFIAYTTLYSIVSGTQRLLGTSYYLKQTVSSLTTKNTEATMEKTVQNLI